MSALRDVAPLLREPIFLILFCWFLVALGYRIARILRVPLTSLTRGERGLVCSALGAGFVQYLPFTLGELGWLSATSVRVAMAVLVLLLAPDLVRVARAVAAAARELGHARPSSGAMLWASVLVAIFATMLVRSVIVDAVGDDDGYHLTAPKRWLEQGALVYLPTYTHTNAPMGFEMLFAIGLATWDAGGAKTIHLAAAGFCLLGLFLAGRRLGRPTIGLVPISLLLVPNPAFDFPYLAAVAYNDLAVCWATVTSVLLWLVWRERRESSLLLCAALCAGFAGSFKFPALSVGMALILIMAWEAYRGRLTRPVPWALLAGCAVLAVAPVLPWLFRNWQVTGNPLYPMFSSVLPTRDWSQENGRVFGLFFRYYNWAKASGQRLSELRRKELLAGAGLAVVVALGVAIRLARRPVMRDLLAFAGVVLLVALALTGLYFRFWMPALAVLGLVFGRLLADRWSDRALVWASSGLLVVGLVLHLRGERARFWADLRTALGQTAPELRAREAPFWDTWSFLNANTPVNAHILIASFYTAFGASSAGAFWVDRPCYATDSHLQGFVRLDEWPAFLESIKRADIAYVVVPAREFLAGRHGFAFPAAANEYRFARRLVDEYGSRVSQHDYLQVYRLGALPVTAASASK
jgi:hypothetical protein